jgi:hypothetical protein
MFLGGSPSRFVFIIGSDDLSRSFDEDERGNDRRQPYPAGYRIRLRGEIKPVPQEVDVPGWNLLPRYHSAPMRGVRLGPNESLWERGRRFDPSILSRHGLVYKSVGSPCAFDERKEIGIRMAARDVRNGNSGERGRDCGAGREKSAQGVATGGCFRQSSGVCPHGVFGHWGYSRNRLMR